MESSINRIPLTISVYPHFMDHRFGGRVVFPAVELLKILAGLVEHHSFFNAPAVPGHMTDARFNKFLVLEPGQDAIETVINVRPLDDTRISLSLATHVSAGNRTMTRLQAHATATFGTGAPQVFNPPENIGHDGPVFQVAADRLYQELVPFGPAFHSVKGMVTLSKSYASADLTAGRDDPADRLKRVLGSGYPLDGAFHAGCVWSQRYFNIVAFPVGFYERVIYRPTVENGNYSVRVIPKYRTGGSLEFDIWITDDKGKLCETVLGVMMRDVSGGAITPPAWIREGV